MRGGPFPFIRSIHQIGAQWIQLYVLHNVVVFLLIPNPVIVRLILPEGMAGSIKQCVRFPRGVSFQGLVDTLKGIKLLLGLCIFRFWKRSQKKMHMVGENNKLMQVVQIPVMMKQGLNHCFRNAVSCKPVNLIPVFMKGLID